MADVFLRGTELMKDAHGITSLVCFRLTQTYFNHYVRGRADECNYDFSNHSRLVFCLCLSPLLKHLLLLSRLLLQGHCIMLLQLPAVCPLPRKLHVPLSFL